MLDNITFNSLLTLIDNQYVLLPSFLGEYIYKYSTDVCASSKAICFFSLHFLIHAKRKGQTFKSPRMPNPNSGCPPCVFWPFRS